MPEDVSQKVTSIIADTLHIPIERVTLDSSFAELRIDSLAGVSIIADLEDAFGIEIPDEDALRVRSVREVVDSLRKALEARGRGPAQA